MQNFIYGMLALVFFILLVILVISLLKHINTPDKFPSTAKVTLIGMLLTALLATLPGFFLNTNSKNTSDKNIISPQQTTQLPRSVISGPDLATCNVKDRRNPETFFSGKLRVGIKGNIPKWSFGPLENPIGFDVDLAKFLKRYLNDTYGYDFDLEYKRLDSHQRAQALHDGCVDLVIANYSMTQGRDKGTLKEPAVDFAGPYFLDKSGWVYNNTKLPPSYNGVTPLPSTRSVCFVSTATTANDIEKCTAIKQDPSDNILECEKKLANPRSDVTAIISDISILAAYSSEYKWPYPPVAPVTCDKNKKELLNNDEKYGVGVQDDSPELCNVLNGAISAFIKNSDGWGKAFDDNFENTVLNLNKNENDYNENDHSPHKPIKNNKDVSLNSNCWHEVN